MLIRGFWWGIFCAFTRAIFIFCTGLCLLLLFFLLPILLLLLLLLIVVCPDDEIIGHPPFEYIILETLL